MSAGRWVGGGGSGGIGLQDQWEEGTENCGRDAVARVSVCMGCRRPAGTVVVETVEVLVVIIGGDKDDRWFSKCAVSCAFVLPFGFQGCI